MKRRLLLLLLLWGPGLSAAEDGGQPFSWLKLGSGARGAALGGAVSALKQGADALSSNPALMALNDSIDIAAQTSFLALDRSLEHVALVRPFTVPAWRAGMGIGFSRFAVNAPIEVRSTNTLDPDREIRDSQFAVRLGFGSFIGRSDTAKVAWGMGGRYMSEQLGESTGTGMGADMGLLWRPMEGMHVGLFLSDMFSAVSWNSGSIESMPSTWHAAMAYQWPQLPLLMALELEQSSEQALRPHLGLEYSLFDGILDLRAGLRDLNWSSGLGLYFYAWGTPASIDYSLGSDSVSPGALTQRLSLNISFAVEAVKAKE